MAIYIPPIKNYAPFYIQRTTDANAVNIQTAWGVTVKVHEYPSRRRVKEPYRNNWNDRSGDDEWNDVMHYEAITLTMQCVILTQENDSDTARAELKRQMRAFQNAIANGEFSIYDDWTKYGFRKVRIQEFQEIREGDFSSKDNHCRLIFSVVLKVNDPMTGMTLSGGKIVEE